MHTELSSQLAISVSQGRARSQSFSGPLLACHERQQRDRLAQVAKAQGGVIIAREGLAPPGGEPHMWCMRELSTGLTLRSGWLCQQDQPPFEAFLEPLQPLEWPMRAVRSAKQTGFVPAVAAVVPHSRQQRCQAPSRRPLAEPLAEAEAAFKRALRQRVRQHVGHVIRQEPRTEPGPAGVLTVTGLVPSPLQEPQALVSHHPTRRGSPLAPEPDADEVVAQLVRHTRSLLTRKGRPPFRLAGIETDERLDHGACGSLERLAQRYAPRLARLSQGLQAAWSPCAQTHREWQPGGAWLRDIASSGAPVPSRPLNAHHVAGPWRDSLDTGRCWPQAPPT